MSDLISRSALLADINSDREAAKVHPREICERFERFCDYAEEVVKDAPAVDAVEVRHGRWISENIRKKSYLRQCSVCNKIAYFCGTGCSYKYCPNCGAKMDGEQNDIQRV